MDPGASLKAEEKNPNFPPGIVLLSSPEQRINKQEMRHISLQSIAPVSHNATNDLDLIAVPSGEAQTPGLYATARRPVG
jgi:hypothetical protein